jgi:hypothetical protein
LGKWQTFFYSDRLENHPANGKQGPEEMFQNLLTNENQGKVHTTHIIKPT